MTFNSKALLLLSALAAAAYYHSQYAGEKERADAAVQSLHIAHQTINDMQKRLRSVAALDAKYSGELADAQENINRLERAVAAGHKRLRLNATCEEDRASSATGMDDAATPRLADAAERDYLTLRRRIETVTRQLIGLQAYVREQCLY
ncbi:lysis protein [Pseudescherichia sp.]|uniref:lysis protein n=1 Tax=Pseudescherichia sp. TaxID=2055881 RepID=UPI00289BD702|nr:lysis protein [Pseudescherichia sp.]